MRYRTLEILLCILAFTARGAEPEHVDISAEIRLHRRHAMVELSGGSSHATRDTFERYRLQARAEGEWDNGVKAALTLQSEGFAHRALEEDASVQSIAEAALHFSHIGFLPLSASLGRQTLHQGRGLLLSAEDRAWSFDGVRLRADLFPRRWELLAGRVTSISPDSTLDWITLASLHHEPPRPPLGTGTLYAGAAGGNEGPLLIAGARAEWLFTPAWSGWSEGALQGGEAPDGTRLGAWITDLGLEARGEDRIGQPSSTLQWTFASGDRDEREGKREFVPMMDQGYGGMVLRPRLANLHILAWRNGFKAFRSVHVGLEGYAYFQHQPQIAVPGRAGWAHEGLQVPSNGTSRELGWEVNLVADIQLAEEASARIGIGRFEPGAGYRGIMNAHHTELAVELAWRY